MKRKSLITLLDSQIKEYKKEREGLVFASLENNRVLLKQTNEDVIKLLKIQSKYFTNTISEVEEAISEMKNLRDLLASKDEESFNDKSNLLIWNI